MGQAIGYENAMSGRSRQMRCGQLCSIGLWLTRTGRPIGFVNHLFKATLFLVAFVTSTTAKLPNFVFIIADDCTYRDIGCYGGQAHTPHIDRLAESGMRFTRCFQAAPMCSPTRHNIYTGNYPVKTGAYPNHTFARAGTKSIVHYLKPKGYRVALSGKTHINPRDVFPFEYSAKQNNPDMAQIGQLFAESSQAGTPFCLFACSNEPHTPWNKGDPSRYPTEQIKLPPTVVDTPEVREYFGRYLAEITYFDGQVGQILSLLHQHQLEENTLVMLVSEQGSGFPFAKWTCYSDGLQSAMIVRWPPHVAEGSTSNALVEYSDVLPTFAEAAGVPVGDDLDGVSFLPVLRGETDHHKSHVFGLMTTRGIINGSSAYGIRTVRDRRYRLIWNLNHETKFTNACTSSKYFAPMLAAAQRGDEQAKSIVNRYQHRPEFELYDCNSDPMELNNLAEKSAYANIKNRLKNVLDQWMLDQGDQGLETELDALAHQTKYKDLSREDAVRRWQQRTKK